MANLNNRRAIKPEKNVELHNSSSRKKRKKTAAVITAAACGICVVGLFFLNVGELNFDFSIFHKETEQVEYDGYGQHRISLYDPDWLDKNRYITYTENGMSLTLVDYDYASCGKPVEMFGEYVDALMHGDAEKVNSFYTDSYFETHDRFEKITMQKLYNIEVEYISESEIEISGRTVVQYIYKFTYMIMENDGTFRGDLVSDAMKPQYYTLIEDNDEIKISDISYIFPG